MRVRSIGDVAAAARGRRIDLKLSQSALAACTGISRKWISEFEAGKATAEFGLVLRVLEGLGLELELDIDQNSHAAQLSYSKSAATKALHAQAAIDLDALLEEYRKE